MSSLVDRFIHKYGRLPTEVDPDYLEMLHMSKYQISDVPMFKPGKCANCGSSKNDGRKYVDFGLEVDWYGTVFLCGHCLTDVANAMGLFDDLKRQLTDLQVDRNNAEELQEQGEALHETVISTFKEFENYYDRLSLHTAGNHTPSDITPSVVPDETTVEPGIDETKPRPVKSTSGSRRTNLRSLTDLLDEPND